MAQSGYPFSWQLVRQNPWTLCYGKNHLLNEASGKHIWRNMEKVENWHIPKTTMFDCVSIHRLCIDVCVWSHVCVYVYWMYICMLICMHMYMCRHLLFQRTPVYFFVCILFWQIVFAISFVIFGSLKIYDLKNCTFNIMWPQINKE